MDNLKIHCDGGSRGNPGKAAASFVVYQGEEILYKEGKYLGITTNNVAEYSGVLMAMKWLLEKNIDTPQITFHLDSELVAKQLTGIYKIKNKNLLAIALEIKDIEKKLKPKIIFRNVRREKNADADSLVNETLNSSRR